MKTKKLLSVMLCIAMVLSTISLTAFAADNGLGEDGEEWGDLGGDTTSYDITIGNIGYATLDDAIAAAQDDDVITIAAGTYDMPEVRGKKITFKGAENKATTINMKHSGANGSSITFDGIVAVWPDGNDMDTPGYYSGLAHIENLTYINSTIKGKQFLYTSGKAIFERCEFINTTNNYCVWTYGAKDVTFTDCVFNTDGKAVLVYTEKTHTAVINVTGCTFNATTDRGKAAIELGQSANGAVATYSLNITESTADKNFSANNSNSNLWGNKNDMQLAEDGSDGIGVTVDGKVYDAVVAEIGDAKYASFDKAIEALKEGDTLTIVDNTFEEIVIARDLKNVTITAKEGVTVNGILFDTKKDAPGTGRTFENITVTDIDFVNQGVNFNCGGTPWVTVKGFTMTDCSFEGEKKAAATGNRLFDIGTDSPGSNQFHNIVIKDCTVDGCTQGIRLGALYGNCEISNNKINNASHNSITLRSIVTADVAVTANQITNGGDRAFRIGSQDSSAEVSFTNNTIDDKTGDPEDGSNFKTNAGTGVPAPEFEGNTVGGQEWTPCVAQIGETKYLALKDAFAAAKSMSGEVTIKLLSDVDLNGWKSVSFDKMGLTSLTIDGNGKTITNLSAPLIDGESAGNTGIANAGNANTTTIKDLTIEDASIASNTAGALIGWYGEYDENDKLVIENVTVTGSTLAATNNDLGYAGGLVGYITTRGTVEINDCTVSNCNITGVSSTGALVGHKADAGALDINACKVGENTITSTDENYERPDKVGAVIGRNNGGETKISVTETASSTLVPGGTATGRIVGSIVGGAVEITGGSYFADPTLTEKDTKPTVAEGYELTKNDDGKYSVKSAVELSTEADGGYYADEKGIENAEKGEVAFRTVFEDYADYDNLESFGVYVYTGSFNEAQNIKLSKEDKDALAENNGIFTGTVTEIGADNFETLIFAKPYAVIGGKVFYGEVVSTSVAGANKWIGYAEKEAE